VLEGLILDVHVFGLGAFANSVSVLPVFGAVFGDVNPEKDLAAPRVLTLLFTEFLATSGLG
jgi:hypothetical protein